MTVPYSPLRPQNFDPLTVPYSQLRPQNVERDSEDPVWTLRSLDKVINVQLDNIVELEKENGGTERKENFNPPKNSADEVEDCARCRGADCDVFFALFMTTIIFGLLILVVVYWVRGLVEA